jgi:hypothetical protein
MGSDLGSQFFLGIRANKSARSRVCVGAGAKNAALRGTGSLLLSIMTTSVTE